MYDEKKNGSIKDAVYHSILDDILSDKYSAGEILNEKALIERYGFSKTPIREALICLCNDDVLRNIPRFGYEITAFKLDDVREMMQFRYYTESGVLVQGARFLTPSHIQELRDINRQCEEAGADLWLHWDMNTRFHVSMMNFCNNSFAAAELQRCMLRLKLAYSQLYRHNPEKNIPIKESQHREMLINALEKNDKEAILSSVKGVIRDFGGPHFPL